MKYLFKCEYDDVIYEQGDKDVSLTDPTKSAYYDIKDKDIKRFWLVGEKTYLVDLTDGHFEIDGTPFKMHEEDLKDFRLVYYRKNTVHFNGTTEIGREVEYCFGWQTTEGGKNYKQILRIN